MKEKRRLQWKTTKLVQSIHQRAKVKNLYGICFIDYYIIFIQPSNLIPPKKIKLVGKYLLIISIGLSLNQLIWTNLHHLHYNSYPHNFLMQLLLFSLHVFHYLTTALHNNTIHDANKQSKRVVALHRKYKEEKPLSPPRSPSLFRRFKSVWWGILYN